MLRALPFSAALIALAALTAPVVAQQAAEQFKPYKAVTIAPPADVKDADLITLRAKIADVTKNRDRAALAKLVVTNGFFWDRDGKDAGRGRPAMEALSAALGLTRSEGVGWDMLGGFSDLPTVAPAASRKNSACVPGDPRFDGKAFDALLKETQTEVPAWTYPLKAGVDVRAMPQKSAPVIDKLGSTFIRVLPEAASRNPNFIRVLTPAGKPGYVAIEAVATYGNDQLCFAKEGGIWKIGGYIGTGDPQ